MPYLEDREEILQEFFSHHDYKREAYGDPCPCCGELRWGGDCPACSAREEAAALDFELREAADRDGGL